MRSLIVAIGRLVVKAYLEMPRELEFLDRSKVPNYVHITVKLKDLFFNLIHFHLKCKIVLFYL